MARDGLLLPRSGHGTVVRGIDMEGTKSSIDDLYSAALGEAASPFSYQRRIAEEGLPELLDVATGCGKTPAMALGWLYRRRFHPDSSVRRQTPRRLVWCLPMRTLVNQTAHVCQEWVRATGCDAIGVYELLGGEPTRAQEWRLDLDGDAIIVGTLDMLLSRALNRGYLASRFAWPIDFALFNNDCHWVFDEVQLMDVALGTSRQLHGLRRDLGVSLSCGSTWMSATVNRDELRTVDARNIDSVVAISEEEVDERLARRLDAPKFLVRREVDDPSKFARGFAEIVSNEHQSGSATLAVLNTVDMARAVSDLLSRTAGTEVVLLHSRFRPPDRAALLHRALEIFAQHRDGIVVSTQVIEAGVDLSAATLVTETAPWSSITQRAGRCNRWGELAQGRMIVVRHSKPGPYEPAHLDEAWAACAVLDDTTVTPRSLASLRLDERRPPHPLLRRKDLLDLFDTAPDLSGNDVDVSRFIRLDGGLDLAVAWRPIDPGNGPIGNAGLPSRDERCTVPLAAARRWLKRRVGQAWVPDESSRRPTRDGTAGFGTERRWRPATDGDLRPGVVLIVPSSLGGYRSDVGFDPDLKEPVDAVAEAGGEGDPTPVEETDLTMDDDPLSDGFGVAITLRRHLGDVAAVARALCDAVDPDPSGPVAAAVVRAGRLHDIGKAHDVWQQAVCALTEEQFDEPLAKSGKKGRLRYRQPHFRHELASALALVAHPALAIADPMNPDLALDADLVTYLVGAHHGRIRLSIPSRADEDDLTVLGVRQDDTLPVVDLGNGESTPEAVLSVEVTRLGSAEDGGLSWTTRSARLLDLHGPFRLAWLETLVRIADWRASNQEASE